MVAIKLYFMLLCVYYSYGFYFQFQESNIRVAQLKGLDTRTTIRTIRPSKSSVFPLEIRVSYTDGNQENTYLLQKTDFNNNSPRTYFGNPITGFNVLDTNFDLKAAHYTTQDNATSATLILNNDLNAKKIATDQYFRILLTSTNSENQITLTPTLINTKSLGRKQLIHTIERKKLKDIHNFGMDFLKAKAVDSKFRLKTERIKRAVNGQPLTLYAETLIVADHSILDKQKVLLNTNDNILCFQHMKIYYSHIMAAVSLRYENSLANDPDLRIKIRIANFLFQTTQTESNWTNPTYVGVSGLPTFNGRVVVDASLCLQAFSNYMSALSLSFDYDHAVGLMNKDIYYAGSTSTVGLAWTPGMCITGNKYSIVEDNGFITISVIAHEMGHNFGSIHDGDPGVASGCPASLNYIMTPGVGAYTSYYNNTFLFSPCSITQIKSTILVNNGNPSTYGNCLLNVPPSEPIETTYFNLSMSGQLWSSSFQCKMRFGTSYFWCPWQNISKICETIYCTDDGSSCSWSNGVGAVDGTPCGTNRVCVLGQCVSSSVTKTPTLSGNICGPPNPCLNGGTCTVIESLYICACPAGYSGVSCEISLNSITNTADTTAIPTSAAITVSTAVSFSTASTVLLDSTISTDTALSTASTVPIETTISTTPSPSSASTVPVETTISTTPSTSSASTVPVETTISTTPSTSSASTVPIETTISTTPSTSSASTVPVETTISTTPSTSSASTVPVETTISTTPSTSLASTILLTERSTSTASTVLLDSTISTDAASSTPLTSTDSTVLMDTTLPETVLFTEQSSYAVSIELLDTTLITASSPSTFSTLIVETSLSTTAASTELLVTKIIDSTLSTAVVSSTASTELTTAASLSTELYVSLGAIILSAAPSTSTSLQVATSATTRTSRETVILTSLLMSISTSNLTTNTTTLQLTTGTTIANSSTSQANNVNQILFVIFLAFCYFIVSFLI